MIIIPAGATAVVAAWTIDRLAPFHSCKLSTWISKLQQDLLRRQTTIFSSTVVTAAMLRVCAWLRYIV